MQLPHDWWFQVLGILIGAFLAYHVNQGPHVILKNYPPAIQMHGDK
jgi:hypothetical protein